MKIRIWQQFSSNNSSSFVIVGHFETQKQAQDTATTLRDILRRMWNWYAAHPEERETAMYVDTPPTGAEQIVTDEYQIEFEEATDWVAVEKSPDFVNDAVTSFENHVYLAILDETLRIAEPFVALMRKLGADIKYHDGFPSELSVNISAMTPDDTTAQYIKSASEAYLTRNRGSDLINTPGRPPWAQFYSGQLSPNLEQLNTHINIYLDILHNLIDWKQANQEQIIRLNERLQLARRDGFQKQAEEFEQKLQVLRDTEAQIMSRLSTTDFDNVEKLLDLTTAQEFYEGEYSISIEIEERQIHLRKLWFFNRSLGPGLTALVTWLRALGCRDVNYEFVPLRHYSSGNTE